MAATTLPPYEVLSLVRVVAEVRLAEVHDAVPPVRPGDILLDVEAVDVEILDAALAPSKTDLGRATGPTFPHARASPEGDQMTAIQVD